MKKNTRKPARKGHKRMQMGGMATMEAPMGRGISTMEAPMGRVTGISAGRPSKFVQPSQPIRGGRGVIASEVGSPANPGPMGGLGGAIPRGGLGRGMRNAEVKTLYGAPAGGRGGNLAQMADAGIVAMPDVANLGSGLGGAIPRGGLGAGVVGTGGAVPRNMRGRTVSGGMTSVPASIGGAFGGAMGAPVAMKKGGAVKAKSKAMRGGGLARKGVGMALAKGGMAKRAAGCAKRGAGRGKIV